MMTNLVKLPPKQSNLSTWVFQLYSEVSPAGSSLREPPGQRYAARCAPRSLRLAISLDPHNHFGVMSCPFGEDVAGAGGCALEERVHMPLNHPKKTHGPQGENKNQHLILWLIFSTHYFFCPIMENFPAPSDLGIYLCSPSIGNN
jgi:hypothetical protein